MFLDALTQTGQLSQFSLISMIAIVFVGVIASVFYIHICTIHGKRSILDKI